MAGIRVRHLPKKTEERHLKIHFSKPEHGGGKILKIYFPLFNNDAVILYSDKKVINKVVKCEHKILSHDLAVEILPEHMVFSSVSAKLDPGASVLVQVTQALRDEMEFAEGIKVEFDQNETCVIQGNWFQLEWAWCYIDCFMRQQDIIQHEISQQPQRYAGTPMEVDESQDLSRSDESADFWPQGHLGDKSDRDRSKKNTDTHTRSVDDETPSLSHRHNDDGIPCLSYRENHSQSKCAQDNSQLVSPPDRRAYDDVDSRSRSALDSMGALKQNIDIIYKKEDTSNSARGRNKYDPYDDLDFSLHGRGFNVPVGTISPIGQEKLDRSADENSTFRQFSGLDSQRPHSPVGHQAAASMHASNDDGNLWSHQQKSPSLHPGLNLSGDKSPSTSQSSRKRSVDSIDHSLGLTKAGISVQPIPDKYTADQLCHVFNINGLTVVVYHGDLVKETTDAIVNAANEELEFHGGIAYAIEKARGPDMKQELQRYMLKNGRLNTTEVMHTSGGEDIKATHIIHAAGPLWSSRGDERRNEETAYRLMKTFLNCLEYAEERLWIKSLALPAISSGVYGAPLDICVRCFLDAVLIFTDKHMDQRRVAEVRLVNNDAESTVTSIVLIQTLLEQGIHTLTAAATQLMEKFYVRKDRRLDLPRGRQEKSKFSSTMMQHTSTGSAYGMDSPLSDTKTSTSAHRRRSSSLDARPKKKSTDTSTKTYDPKSGTFVHEKKQPDSAAGSGIVDRHRARTGSFSSDANKSTKPALSSTIGGTSGLRMNEYSSKSSSRYGSTADKVSKTSAAPKIKESLFNSSRLGNFKKPSPKKTEHSRYHTTDHLGGTSHTGLKKSTMNVTSDEEDQEYGLRSLPADFHTHSSLTHQTSFRDKFLNASSNNTETCAICLDEVRNPKQLAKCKHKFCTPCIERHFRSSKPTCPTCGAVYGRITGTQPRSGRMTHVTDRSRLLPGYEGEDGMIVITYTFPDGVQESCHPEPGRPYKGLSRKAFLPNSVEGREVLRLLKRAFDARMVFTIGDSKTRGESGMLTWNDIHHKTSLRGGPTKFGYPDPDYLRRVKEELAAVGISSD